MNFKYAERRKFIAFRTEFIYWAGDKIDLPKSNFDEFNEQVKNPVFIYEDDFYTLCFCHTGLILLHVAGLETKEDEVFQSYEEIWKLEQELDEHEKIGDEDGMKRVAEKVEVLLREREKHRPDKDKEVNKWEKYFRYVNSLHFILISLRQKLSGSTNWSTSWTVPSIGIMDTSRFIIRDGKFDIYSFESLIVTNRVFAAYQSSESNRWGVVSKDTFDEINRQFSIVTRTPRLAERLSQLLKASKEYENHNLSYALLLAWLVIESALTDKWEGYLRKNADSTSGKKRINAERNKVLTGRDYTISVITNFLELANEITFDQFLSLDTIRKVRNKIIHGEPNFLCSEEDCKRAIRLALELSTEGTPLNFEWNFVMTLPSLM